MLCFVRDVVSRMKAVTDFAESAGMVVSLLLFMTAFLPVIKIKILDHYGFQVSFIKLLQTSYPEPIITNIGIFIIIIAVMVFVLSVFDINIGVSLGGLLSIGLCVYFVFEFPSKKTDFFERTDELFSMADFGFWLFFIFSVAIVFCGFYGAYNSSSYIYDEDDEDDEEEDDDDESVISVPISATESVKNEVGYEEKSSVQCPSCGWMVPAEINVCPHCGMVLIGDGR